MFIIIMSDTNGKITENINKIIIGGKKIDIKKELEIEEEIMIHGGNKKTEIIKISLSENLLRNERQFYDIIEKIIRNKNVNDDYFKMMILFPAFNYPVTPIINLFKSHLNNEVVTSHINEIYEIFIKNTNWNQNILNGRTPFWYLCDMNILYDNMDKNFKDIHIKESETILNHEKFYDNLMMHIENNNFNIVRMYHEYLPKLTGNNYVVEYVNNINMLKFLLNYGYDINLVNDKGINFSNIFKFMDSKGNSKYTRIIPSKVVSIYDDIYNNTELIPDKEHMELINLMKKNMFNFSKIDGYRCTFIEPLKNYIINKASDYFVLYIFKLLDDNELLNIRNIINGETPFIIFLKNKWERLIMPLFINKRIKTFIDLRPLSKIINNIEKYDYDIYINSIIKTLASIYYKNKYECTLNLCKINWNKDIIKKFIIKPTTDNATQVINSINIDPLFDHELNEIIETAYDKIYNVCIIMQENKEPLKFPIVPDTYWYGSQLYGFFAASYIVKLFKNDCLFIPKEYYDAYRYYTIKDVYFKNGISPSFNYVNRTLLPITGNYKWMATEYKNFMKSNCRFTYHVLVISFSNGISHANILVIDKNRKVIEHFEPDFKLGGDYNDIMYTKIKLLYKKYFKKFRYIAPDELMGNHLLQHYADNDDIYKIYNEIDGYCLLWVYWYLYMRLLNPDIRDLIGEISQNFGELSYQKNIRGFSYKITKNISKIINSEGISTKEYDEAYLSKNQFKNIAKKIINYITL